MINRVGLGIITGSLAFLSGCNLDIDLTSTPDTVEVGAQVSHTIKITNNSKCPLVASELRFWPHLTAADEALIEVELPPQLTIARLCEIEATGFPDGFAETVGDSRQIANLGAQERGGAAIAKSIVNTGVMCQPMTGLDGIDFFDCTIDPLPSGEMATIELQVTAAQVGTVRNVAARSSDQVGGVCDGGTQAGQSCRDDFDCPGAGCDSGICQGGDGPGLGCNVDTDCAGEGTCISCTRCLVAGVCVMGTNQGSACFTGADCGPDFGPQACWCGAPIDCTLTTVVARVAKAPAVSSGGLVAMIAALICIAALMLRRRFRGPVTA